MTDWDGSPFSRYINSFKWQDCEKHKSIVLQTEAKLKMKDQTHQEEKVCTRTMFKRLMSPR